MGKHAFTTYTTTEMMNDEDYKNSMCVDYVGNRRANSSSENYFFQDGYRVRIMVSVVREGMTPEKVLDKMVLGLNSTDNPQNVEVLRKYKVIPVFVKGTCNIFRGDLDEFLFPDAALDVLESFIPLKSIKTFYYNQEDRRVLAYMQRFFGGTSAEFFEAVKDMIEMKESAEIV